MIDPITGNERRIARITYNSKGWIEPSGREGKSKSKDAYEGKHGMGHEEWLFDFSKIIRGYNYGFIESIYKNQGAYAGKTFDIYLFTLNHSDKVKYWIAVIRNCYILTQEEIDAITPTYNKPTWRREREEQLNELGLLTAATQHGLDVFFPVVRFKKEDVQFFDPPIPITDTYINNLNRYQLFKWDGSIKFVENLQSGFQFKPSTPNNPLSKVIKGKYEPRSKEVQQLHKEISVALYNEIADKYGKDNIGCDVPTGQGTFIDMVRKNGNDYVFYEIKTYNDLRKNIREAFGQLMEYAFWKLDKQVKEIIIVTDQKPSNDSMTYMKYLRENFNVPIFYQRLDLNTNRLSATF